VLVLGDPRLGAVLRALRMERGLTRDVVAGLVPCAPSLVSQVESGARALLPWLAGRLDQVYGSGATISVLTGPGGYHWGQGCANLEADDRVVLVRLPKGEVMVPVSRRALLVALGSGSTVGVLRGVHDATAAVPADEELLAGLTDSLRGLQAGGFVLPPAQLVDSLTGQVALLEVMRRRAPVPLRRDYAKLQAQYAGDLSWMVHEAGDPGGALYWIDRVQHWAGLAEWPAMAAYAHVRRSTMVSSSCGDGRAAVEHAVQALRTIGAPAQVRGEAAKQLAYGYALAGNPDACHRALDLMAGLFDLAPGDADAPDQIIGLRGSGATASLLAQFRATCDVYLGGGQYAVAALDSSRAAYAPGSRPYAITSARLAQAYAQAGAPEQACALAVESLGTAQALDSLSARTELRRMLPPLNRWPSRQDVAEVRHRINALSRPPGSGLLR
jgi:hypothetical protein